MSTPHMAPRDFFLFSLIKNSLKGEQFKEVDTIKLNTTQQLLKIPKTVYERCFQQWKSH
jgi:hypothetical protein